MPAFQSAIRYLTPPKNGCIEVHGYTPLNSVKTHNFMDIDQRERWWSQYASLTGADQTLPSAFSSAKLASLTHEPLLCYLLVLSGYATENAEQAADNQNIIYKQLVDSIWQRGWGDGHKKRQGPGRNLSKAEFNLLMQTIAMAAWQGGDTRVASEAGFQAAISVAGAKEAWESFKSDNGPDVTNLAMNFYMKSTEEGQRGFEFTHKSFGDYLAARAILDVALDLPSLIDRKVDHALSDWVEATATGNLTIEILQFLRDEVRLRMRDGRPADIKAFTEAKRAFERLISTALSDGMPMHSGTCNWRTSESRQANAESMAWAVVNALSLALSNQSDDIRLVNVTWPNERASFADLLRRLTRGQTRNSAALGCFSNILAPNADVFGLALSHIDLRGAHMPNANFNGMPSYRGGPQRRTL